MIKPGQLLLLACVLALAGGEAVALRCGTALVELGDRSFQVHIECGEPDYVDSYPQAFIPGVGFVGEIEEWYYNRGPTYLVRILMFRNGRLIGEHTGGHGFVTGVRGKCRPQELRPGMSKFELVARCGEPDYRETYFQVGSPWHHGHSHAFAARRVDEWTYNFGSSQFLRHVLLIDGRVLQVSEGDRGY